MTRHHAKPNINVLLTRNLPLDSDIRQQSYPLMIPLHCLLVKLNNRMHSQFEYDVTYFCFCFDFVHSHAQFGEGDSFEIGCPRSMAMKTFWT